MLFASKAFASTNRKNQAGTAGLKPGLLDPSVEATLYPSFIPEPEPVQDDISDEDRLELRNSRIQELYPLVKSVARRVARAYPKADVEELVSDGCVGLIRSVDLFDPTRGVTLEAYARRLIIGAIFNGLRKRDPLTSRVRRAMREAEDERYRIASARGTLPTMVEMEKRDKKLSAVRTKAMQRSIVSLDAPLPPGLSVGASNEKNPETIAVERAMLSSALEAINSLPDRQREVMMLYYMGHVPLPAIADKLGVTRQRASQIHREALKAVADYMNTNPG